MCTHPIKIYNKSHYHNPKAIRLYMTVPCGKCAECIAQKRAEWSLRSQLEYEYCLKNDGYAFFDTLTYSNQYIPRFRNHACFQRKHIQDFLKRMRKRIASDLKITQHAFRYFYVSEYGYQYKRPHYHIIFFVSSSIPVKYFKKVIMDSWPHGFTDLTSVKMPIRGIVQSRMCCEYVTKYVTKPDSYISDLYEEFKDSINKEDFNKHFAPFHQQSNGFGECLLFDSRNLQNFKEMFCVFNRQKYTLPLYYIRKLYYKLVENPDGSKSWRTTDLGNQFIPQYKYQLYEDYTKSLCSFVDAIPQFLAVPKVSENVTKFLCSDDYSLSKDFISDISNYQSLCRFFDRYSSDFVSNFAYWKRFEQGYIIYDSSFNPLIDFDANVSELIYFDCSDNVDRCLLSARLDANSVPDYLFFDRLLNVIRSSVGDMDNCLLRLTEKTKRLFTYFNYAN